MNIFLQVNKNCGLKYLMPVYDQFLCSQLSITHLIHGTQQDAKKIDSYWTLITNTFHSDRLGLINRQPQLQQEFPTKIELTIHQMAKLSNVFVLFCISEYEIY
jgi:hypothetical protein